MNHRVSHMMAHAVIGGIITSTLLTLVVVPVIYTYLDDLARWAQNRFGAARAAAAPGDDAHHAVQEGAR